MKLIQKIKNAHMEARKAGDKLTVSVLTMLLSRADSARSTQYNVKSTDDLTDDQVMKVLQAEIKSINGEIKAFESIDQARVDKAKSEVSVLTQFVPAELSNEEVTEIVKQAIIKAGDTVNMGTVIKLTKEIYENMNTDKTLPLGMVSQIAKSSI